MWGCPEVQKTLVSIDFGDFLDTLLSLTTGLGRELPPGKEEVVHSTTTFNRRWAFGKGAPSLFGAVGRYLVDRCPPGTRLTAIGMGLGDGAPHQRSLPLIEAPA